jgi:hypothetical protein
MTAFTRTCTLAILAGVLLAPAGPSLRAGPAVVQSTEWGGTEDPVGGPVRRSERAPVVERSRLDSVLGKNVRTKVEEDGGRIIDLLADRSGNVEAAVIEFGGFLGIGTRKIAVEWSALRFESDGKENAIIVDVTRDQLRAAPEWKPNEPAIVRRASN